MNKMQELDERRNKALDEMGKVLAEINGTSDVSKKMKLHNDLNDVFGELRAVANERVLYTGGYLK